MRKPAKCLTAILLFGLSGCVSVPPDIFRLPANSLAKRQLETRQYETTDEARIISACAGLLQDFGFTLDESETGLGLIVASKDRSAINGGQIALATFVTALSAFSGTYQDAYSQIDRNQKLRAAVVTHLSEDRSRVLVRVSFQRVVWNRQGLVTRMETLNDPKLYEDFFERLSKSIFLEEQKI